MTSYHLKELISLCPTSFNTNFVKYDLPSIRENHTFSSPLGYNSSVNWVDVKDIGEIAAKLLLFYCLPKYHHLSFDDGVSKSTLIEGLSSPSSDLNTRTSHRTTEHSFFLQSVSKVSIDSQHGQTCHKIVPITGGE